MSSVDKTLLTELQNRDKEQPAKISLYSWWNTDSCGDGCCSEWGTALFIDETLITEYFQGTEEDIRVLLDALNVKYEIEDSLSEKVTEILGGYDDIEREFFMMDDATENTED